MKRFLAGVCALAAAGFVPATASAGQRGDDCGRGGYAYSYTYSYGRGGGYGGGYDRCDRPDPCRGGYAGGYTGGYTGGYYGGYYGGYTTYGGYGGTRCEVYRPADRCDRYGGYSGGYGYGSGSSYGGRYYGR